MKQIQCLWITSVTNSTNSLILKFKRALKINQNTDFNATLLKDLKIMTWTFFVKSSFLGLLLKEYPSYLTIESIKIPRKMGEMLLLHII